MIFKMRYTKSYMHVYCTLFVAKSPDHTWANCGKLTIRSVEFVDLQNAMPGVPFEEYNYDPDGV